MILWGEAEKGKHYKTMRRKGGEGLKIYFCDWPVLRGARSVTKLDYSVGQENKSRPTRVSHKGRAEKLCC